MVADINTHVGNDYDLSRNDEEWHIFDIHLRKWGQGVKRRAAPNLAILAILLATAGWLTHRLVYAMHKKDKQPCSDWPSASVIHCVTVLDMHTLDLLSKAKIPYDNKCVKCYFTATAGAGFALVILLAIILVGLWFLHRRRMRRRDAKKMLTWEPKFWHHNDCEKVQPAKACNCPGAEARGPAPASASTSASAATKNVRICTCGTVGGPCRVHPTVAPV